MTSITLREQNFSVLCFYMLTVLCFFSHIAGIDSDKQMAGKLFSPVNNRVNHGHHAKCTVSPWGDQLAAHKALHDCHFLRKCKNSFFYCSEMVRSLRIKIMINYIYILSNSTWLWEPRNLTLVMVTGRVLLAQDSPILYFFFQVLRYNWHVCSTVFPNFWYCRKYQ